MRMVTKVLEREMSVVEVESFTVYIWRMMERAIVLFSDCVSFRVASICEMWLTGCASKRLLQP